MQIPPNVSFIDLHPKTSDFLTDVLVGLSADQKYLPPKYFYDEKGSQLFDAICKTTEYYPTRTEIEILEMNSGAMMEQVQAPVALIEFGSGSSTKIRHLLDVPGKITCYLPIDISKEHLLTSSATIAEAYPKLKIIAICADYTDLQQLPAYGSEDHHSKAIFFPGSTLGNLAPARQVQLLRNMNAILTSGEPLFLGIDLLKDESILQQAYNDRSGRTAAFNLNILRHINRRLNANFNIDQFAHLAFFNPPLKRIEMHLKSLKDQDVTIGDQTIHFIAGETIHTENSHKFSIDDFTELAEQAGFKVAHYWTDSKKLFAQLCLQKS